MQLEFLCNVCGTTLTISDMSAAQVEMMLEVLARTHAHSPEERAAWFDHEVTLAQALEDEDD